MTVTTQGHGQTQLAPQTRQTRVVSSAQRRRAQGTKIKKGQSANSTVAPGLKASVVGGFGLLILMLISLIPPPENLPFVSLAFLVIPGFLVVCLATGLLAGIFSGDKVSNSQQGGKVGWMAGFWAGIMGGLGAMFMAGQGLLLVDFGQNVVSQIEPELLHAAAAYVTPATLALAARVFGALLVYGLVGALVTALLGTIGGMIYPHLRDS